ncbi:putative disease resistance protein At3g14460 isoform X2 [Corylus avellana]|uniref:putative disease resistance protein At3g14460 isoform X2 n=1 Tax=Corylus avellana TaxID=13451 RepID=UPI00286B8B86|nr:putative disease resistance protein At3g14460 isoform X2 [Corylus avellana]
MAAELALTAAGIVLSPLFQVFYEKMASLEFEGFFRRRKLSDKLLWKLKTALLSVSAVLEDAEDRQFTEANVKEWLDEVKGTIYDAEDILDKIATKDLIRKLDAEFGTIVSKEMPRHLGRLESLRTLTKFVVGKDSGCGIGELKKLNLLRGSLCIENLQNVTSLTDANDLNLVDKKYLEKLKLEWNSREDNTEDTSGRQMVVLNSLQPHSNLKSLTMIGYRGKSFPDWIGQLPSLEKLFISCCPQVESFSEGELPSNLNEISINCCDKLFANRMGWGLQKLQCLRRFTIWDHANDVESFPNEGLLPTSLTHLHIGFFQKLKSLDKKGLQHLTALEDLDILYCPKFECMPKDGLPASLSTLRINGCPLLKKECERKEGEEWRNISHVPNKYIDLAKRIG